MKILSMPLVGLMVSLICSQARAAVPYASTQRYPKLLLASDLAQASGVHTEAQVPQLGRVLCENALERSSLWYPPGAAHTFGDFLVELWYQRVSAGKSNKLNRRTLCLDEIGNEFLVNQIVLEAWPEKRFPDNLGKFKRVTRLRASLDLKTWWRQQPLLAAEMPDALDAEFYLFSAFLYGQGYARLIMKCYAAPAKSGEHCVMLRDKLAVSEDGRTWQRLYRNTELGFYSDAGPLTIDGRMYFATWKDGAMLTISCGQDRQVAVAGDGGFRTRPLARPQKGIDLKADSSQGWIEATLCDFAGELCLAAISHRIQGVAGELTPLSSKDDAIRCECSLGIRLGDGAKVFNVAEPS